MLLQRSPASDECFVGVSDRARRARGSAAACLDLIDRLLIAGLVAALFSCFRHEVATQIVDHLLSDGAVHVAQCLGRAPVDQAGIQLRQV